eukprot:TRINITY_DN3564_c0_g1_i1.p1 TRINITY_DN3564_c0_g1~~TRINITY_DN3564_c0_g1_i1.p1  ORF type:complete len:620 (+),score=148.40 TRINITY_DN3564_c0_g1_i1:197-2056(+)
MGFLGEGNTLVWEEAAKHADYIRKHGIIQFLNVWNQTKDRQESSFTWGDEVEYYMLKIDDEKKKVQVSLRGSEVLAELGKAEHDDSIPSEDERKQVLWRPEYGSFMIEATPGKPYNYNFSEVEPNMRLRRRLAQGAMNKEQGERVITLTSFPHLGVGYFTSPEREPGGPISESLFNPDAIINPHRRFGTLTKNIRERRGSKVCLNIPVFPDTKTSFIDNSTTLASKISNSNPQPSAAKPDCVYLDAMGFGMGCCCLQCTFLARNIDEARYLYDQLSVLAPIMLSATAAGPIYRGYLTNIDVRWQVISAMVDDRTPQERGLEELKDKKFVINKSRYDSIDCFISQSPKLKPEYNDLDLVYDKEITEQLIKGGVDELLARHIGHLFIRDPLVIYDNRIEIDDGKYSDHFENIQTTNWQTVRFKLPPPDLSIGWRVEFRTMEAQFTDFENSAFAVFIAIVARMISDLNLTFYIPISKSDENLLTAHKPGSVVNHKFYWRRRVTAPKDGETEDNTIEQVSVNDILNGSDNVEGIIPLVRSYLDTLNLKEQDKSVALRAISFVSKRASGELITPATWIRNFVRNHPDYKQDSVVSEQINYDLIKTILKIEDGELKVPELLGEFQ